MSLTADQIDKADDLPTKVVPVPEWGGDVRIRTLPCEELDAYEAEVSRMDPVAKGNNWRSRFVVLCLVDDAGNRLFGPDSVARLAKRSGGVIDRLFDACQQFNGMDKKAVRHAEKNSESGPTSGSSSA